MNQPTTLPTSKITPSPTNPRKRFPKVAQAELEASVRLHGILQPLLLRPWPDDASRYELVAGERRYRAAVSVGRTDVPVLVRDLSDDEVLHIQIIENLQRQDLHPIDEAEGYELLTQRNFTLQQIADQVGRSQSYVSQRLKLCALQPAARTAFLDGKLNATTALYVARLPKDLQKKAIGQITNKDYAHPEGMTSLQATQFIQREYMLRLDRAPFKTSDPDLVPAAGPCGSCPKRTGNQPELFEEVTSKDMCTDPACFAKKREAAKARARDEAIEKGQTVIAGAEAKKIKPNSWNNVLQGGYVALEDMCPMDPKRRTYKQIVGKALAPALLEEPTRGDFIPVVHKSDLNRVLKEKGIGIVSRSGDPGQAAERAKTKAENAYRARLFEAVSNAAPPSIANMKNIELRMVMASMYRLIGHDTKERLNKHWGWAPIGSRARDYAERQFEAAADAKLASMLIDMAVSHNLVANIYSRGAPTTLEEAAALFNVDCKAIKRELQAEAKVKTKKVAPVAKKAPAKKPSPKGAPPAKKVGRPPAPVSKKVPAKKRAATKPTPAAKRTQTDTVTPVLKPGLSPAAAWPFPTERL